MTKTYFDVTADGKYYWNLGAKWGGMGGLRHFQSILVASLELQY